MCGSMGLDLGGVSHDQLDRLIEEEEANAAPNAPAAPEAPDAAAGPPPRRSKKRKTREKLTSPAWEHFRKGPVAADGSYPSICLYCGQQYPMGNSRSTSNMIHHYKYGCTKFPFDKMVKKDAKQGLLQFQAETGMFNQFM